MRIDWIDGEPENFVPGMILQTHRGLVIVGNINEYANCFDSSDSKIEVTAWGWIVKPYDLEHIRAMIVWHAESK